MTGDWSKAASRNQISEANSDEDDAAYADFEDLETGEKYESHPTREAGKTAMQKEDNSVIEERRLKKLALRAKFDSEYPFTHDIALSFPALSN